MFLKGVYYMTGVEIKWNLTLGWKWLDIGGVTTHNLLWIREEWTKFHFCALWENDIMKTNQSYVILLCIRSLNYGYSFFFILPKTIFLHGLHFFSALTNLIKSWSDYSNVGIIGHELANAV